MELEVGQKLLHYRLLSRLGAGGGGEVWEAEDEKLGRRVALKVPGATDPRSLARFEREAWALARISHPNVVQVQAIETADEGRFLVLERIEGRTLADVLANRGARLPARDLIEIGAALAAALRAVHAAGVVHRDVKPENVMLTSGGDVKLIDFGIASLAEASAGTESEPPKRLTHHGTVMGTFPYMAPEQMRGRPADPRSDLFALGALLYEAATGRCAFDGETRADTIAAVLRHEPPDLTDLRPDLPPELGAITARCLAKDPEGRFGRAREVEEALAQVLRQLGGSSSPGSVRGSSRITDEVPLSTIDDLASAAGSAGSPRGFPRRRTTAAMTVETIKRHPLVATASGLLLAIAVVFLAAGFWPADAALEPGETLMVLPFADATRDGKLAYLSEGLSAGLASRLGEVSRFRVIGVDEARTAVAAVGDPTAAARRFGAPRVLEGEVRQRNAEVVLVSVRLSDGRSGEVLWADEIEAPLASLLDLQGRIVDRVGRTLAGGELSSDEIEILASHPTDSYEAYDHYLRGVEWLERVTTTQYDQFAAAAFRKAIAEDPEFALAHVGLSEALWTGHHRRDAAGLLEEARREAETALALDPDLAEAHAALAKVQRSSGESEAAIRNLEAALGSHPRRHQVFRDLAAGFEQLGELEEAEASLRYAVMMNDDDWLSWNALGSLQFRLGMYDLARQSFEKAAALAPADVTWPRQNAISVDLQECRYAEAIAAYESIPDVEGDALFESNLGTAYFFLERYDEAELHYRNAVRLSPDDSKVLRNLGDLLSKTGRSAEAHDQYLQARILVSKRRMDDPTNEETQVAYALLSAKLRDCAEAGALARELWEEVARTAKTSHDLAATFSLCGDRDRALEAARDAIERGFPVDFMLDEDELRPIHPLLADPPSAPASAPALP